MNADMMDYTTQAGFMSLLRNFYNREEKRVEMNGTRGQAKLKLDSMHLKNDMQNMVSYT